MRFDISAQQVIEALHINFYWFD